MSNYGLQLWSVHDATEKDFEGAIREVAKMGYLSLEFAGYFGWEAERLRSLMDELSLTAKSTHQGIDGLRGDVLLEQIEYCKKLGIDTIVIPALSYDDETQLDSNIAEMIRINDALLSHGMKLAYHNHAFELMKYPYGKIPLYEIIEKTNLELQPDVFWLQVGGVDPLEFLEKHSSRISIVHIKDGKIDDVARTYTNSSDGVTDLALGEGDVDVKAIHDWCIKNNKRIVVETEGYNPTGLDEAKRCIDYLNSI